MHPIRSPLALGATAVLVALAGCAPDAPTAPGVAATRPAFSQAGAAGGMPSGERSFGQVAVEPAYDDATGALTYLLTPIHAPNPTHANSRATAPLYLVEYPPGSDVGTLNCMGVPGNCPDHDAAVAGFATSMQTAVYGTDPTAVPGHDHLVAVPAGGGDFNIAWEVVEVLFTPKALTDFGGAANLPHVTTEAQLDALVAAGDAVEYDLGFAFICTVVPASTYWKGTPVG